ncbi:hypothetical protein [Agaribacterium haliotis]|uniref:hypothetical protein n=1 Tax=Agaribacterium haliotis TaxID=2013869 RepID=UPI000BB571FA|nr:hypothetical protein [Agaribacterium haliotis]
MKYFFLCRGGAVTGGPEAMHQLAAAAKKVGLDACLVYYPVGRAWEVPEVYREYDINTAERADDSSESVIVACETETGVLRKFKKATCCVWWLSVDNYYKSRSLIKARVRSFIDGYRSFSVNQMGAFWHLAQSEYARSHLKEIGFKNVMMLSDYLNSKFFEPGSAVTKRKAVAYNPAKGREYTMRLIEESRPDLEWVPIVGLSPDGVHQLLREVMVYVDFGGHPGKDRIPREACMSGCCVITGKKGSAGFSQDVPIRDEFKFDQDCPEFSQLVLKKIYECVDEFDQKIEKFKGYQDLIRGQQSLFEREVAEFGRVFKER